MAVSLSRKRKSAGASGPEVDNSGAAGGIPSDVKLLEKRLFNAAMRFVRLNAPAEQLHQWRTHAALAVSAVVDSVAAQMAPMPPARAAATPKKATPKMAAVAVAEEEDVSEGESDEIFALQQQLETLEEKLVPLRRQVPEQIRAAVRVAMSDLDSSVAAEDAATGGGGGGGDGDGGAAVASPHVSPAKMRELQETFNDIVQYAMELNGVLSTRMAESTGALRAMEAELTYGDTELESIMRSNLPSEATGQGGASAAGSVGPSTAQAVAQSLRRRR